MHDNVASRTALMVAAYRARASAAEKKICDDPWAAQLAGDLGAELAEKFDARFPHMELWMALRTIFLDDLVLKYTVIGWPQVVILGAGLDTRAARLAQPGVRFFEVDHPATQAEKRARLAALADYPVDAATYTACNFESGEDFLDQLVASGFDPGQPAVVLWEGVTPYLTEPAVRATARRIAAGMEERSILAFDFIGKRIAEGANIREKDQETRRYVDDLGEPLRFGSNHILPLLYEEGFRFSRTLNFDEIALSYTGTYAREREFRFQYIAVTSRTLPAGVL
jgi:methyltransferase (TIGR00027 family)